MKRVEHPVGVSSSASLMVSQSPNFSVGSSMQYDACGWTPKWRVSRLMVLSLTYNGILNCVWREDPVAVRDKRRSENATDIWLTEAA